MKKVILILLAIGLLSAGYYFFFSETAKKKKLIKKIKSLPGWDVYSAPTDSGPLTDEDLMGESVAFLEHVARNKDLYPVK